MPGYPRRYGHGPRAAEHYATACAASAAVLRREGRAREAADLEAAARTTRTGLAPATQPPDEAAPGGEAPPQWWR